MEHLSRRAFLLGSLACAAGVAAGAPVAAASVPPALTNTLRERRIAQPDGIFRVPTSRSVVALSFDDGPDPHYTPTVLDLLARHGVPATFFLVGVNALRSPDLVARQRRAGHTIGNHTYDHPELERLSPARVHSEIDRASLALTSAGAGSVKLFRPPKGHTDAAVGMVADAERYRTVFWDVCVEHFVHLFGVVDGARATVEHVQPGSIVVAHDGGHVAAPHHPHLDRSKTMAALPLVLAGLHRRGLRVVDVPTLLHLGERYPRR